MRHREVRPAGRGTHARRLLLRTAREHRRSLAVAASSAVVVVAAGIAAPWPLTWVVDAMVVGMLAVGIWLDPVPGLVLAGVVPALALITVAGAQGLLPLRPVGRAAPGTWGASPA